MPRFPRALAVPTLLLALACSSTTPSSSSGGSCPCTVGNAGIHFTLACGQSSCVTLNGQETGYHCTDSGAVEDPAVCLAGSGGTSAAGGSGATGGACAAHTCTSPFAACGAVDDGCGAKLSCPSCSTSDHCSPAGSCVTIPARWIVIGNYQGGTFTLNVDQHIPGLAIGLVSYQPMHVTLTGAFATDVVAVVHAGYQPGSTVSGVLPGQFSDVHAPMVGKSVLVTDIPSSPTPPTKTEIEGYFESVLGGGTIQSHRCQYDAYTGSLDASAASTCP